MFGNENCTIIIIKNSTKKPHFGYKKKDEEKNDTLIRKCLSQSNEIKIK